MMVMLTVWNSWAAEITVWEGPSTVNWSGSISVQSAYVQRMKVGDLITVTATGKVNVEDAGSVNLCTKISTETGNDNQHAKLEQLFYAAANVGGGTFVKSHRLTQAEVTNLHLFNNLHLWGSNVTISQITWTPFDGVLCSTMASSTNWTTYCTVPTDLIPLIQEGDTLVVTIGSKFDGQTNLQLHYRSSVNAESSLEKDQYNIYYPEKVNIPSATEFPYVHKHVVTATDVLAMAEKSSLYLSGCNINVTRLALSKYVAPVIKEVTLSETETVVADNWGAGSISITKEQLALAAAGDRLTVRVTAVSSTDAENRRCVLIQNGSWANFAGVGAISMNGAELPATATFTLTADMLNMIRGNVDGTAEGLKVKGSGITFDEVKLLHTVVKTKGTPATNLWTGSEVISWTADNKVVLPASSFLLAEKGMKLRMTFSNLKLSAQGRIVQGNWSAFTDANTYEVLKTNWGNYYEFDITDDMLTELQTNGLIVSGIGYTLTSIDLIDPDCEYDVLATFDTADIKAWELADGTPNLTVTLQNFEADEVTVPINIALMTDMFTDYNTYSQNVTLAAGETKVTDVEFNDLTAGFYRMAANVAGNKLCTYYIGYNPTAIVSPNDAQPDFWQFWDTWKARLAEIPIDAELTLLEGQEGDARNVYEVKYKSVPETVGGEPVYIYGYYAEPKAEGTYPCIIHFHGTDKSGNLTKPSATETGWCEFRFSARGQTLDKQKNGSEKYRTDPEKENSVDFYAYRLGDNDEHYYRYVYLDTRRAVDFVFSQEKVNKSQVFAAGGSQGGCLTYVCAALSDGKIRAIAPSITGHADFPHTMEIVGWPTNVFNNWINAEVEAGHYADYAAGKAALLQHQSYFDTKNFSSRIYCPVITNFSLQDNTDGPHLNIAPYNLLTNVAAADKQYSINQFKGHATADNWGTTYMTFFQQYINAGTPLTIDNPVTMTSAGYGTYYNSTATQLPACVQAATIDAASGNTLTINWRYDGDDNEKNVIPGGTAVMLKSSAGDHTLTLLPANTDAAPTGNLLKGSDVACTTFGGDKYYKLTYNNSGENLGWYWGAADGAAFTIGAHKAWLALSNGQQAPSFFLLDGSSTTAVATVNRDAFTITQYYDLSGRRVVQPVKGLYIVNGKKVVIK